MEEQQNAEFSQEERIGFEEFRKEVLNDYRLAVLSREASLIGRKEVLTGKAKFGIFGDGKEVPQLAMAKAFRAGDFRSGYYRDQTFVLATGMGTVEHMFAQLYADTDLEREPFSGGRQMNNHFATRSLDPNGEWKYLSKMKNTASDTSPTASQMARAVGLALASKKYRENPDIPGAERFSMNGNEVVFCTIGDASTSEGIFWESLNAAGVLEIPLAISIWDDGYGISVPIDYQTTKKSISEVLKGFKRDENGGLDIYTLDAWDYPALIETYQKGIQKIRDTHIPAVFHVKGVTQPQGHSTSGSHERYKSKERLEWEKEFDCNRKMRSWIESNKLATSEELDEIEKEARKAARESQKRAWVEMRKPIDAEIKEALALMQSLASVSAYAGQINEAVNELSNAITPIRRDYFAAVKKALRASIGEGSAEREALTQWLKEKQDFANEAYRSKLYSESEESLSRVEAVPAVYTDNSEVKNGYEILNEYFDSMLARNPDVFAFGEDLGKIGDVNQGFAGLQAKYGESRVFDTGIREASIVGQGIGMAMRGLRPIAEIQYLDYLIYGLQPIVDDLATLQYRSRGGQKAPVIIRTRGHRLEGIWHTGSPMGMIINSVKGVHVCVPRNMTQAAGMYNALLKSDEPGIIIECLNGYRLKERKPENLADYTIVPGHAEILQEGSDVTLVTYGSTLRVVQDAMKMLEEKNISCELIDVQSLIPFDLDHLIADSVRKTNRVVFIDEDVPGGATAYMMQQVIEEQDAYFWLDSEPLSITAAENRAAYASDGDYFCKPNAEQIFERVYELMAEASPSDYPPMY